MVLEPLLDEGEEMQRLTRMLLLVMDPPCLGTMAESTKKRFPELCVGLLMISDLQGRW